MPTRYSRFFFSLSRQQGQRRQWTNPMVGPTLGCYSYSAAAAAAAAAERRTTSASITTIFSRTRLSEAVSKRVETMVARHAEVVEQLNDPGGGVDTTSSTKDFASLGKEMSSLAGVVSLHEKLTDLDLEFESVQELLLEAIETTDEEMETECRTDLERLNITKEELEKRILEAVLPRDDNDTDSDAILEIRAGTGGDEAALFAGELLQTFINTAKAMKWKVDIMDISKTDLGGIREATINVTGRANNLYISNSTTSSSSSSDPTTTAAQEEEEELVGPYGYFRFESGVHRVQRVPINDTKMHTSACSVAVLPSLSEDNSDSLLPMTELKIETMRASGAGGQHVNTTDSAVRVTHIPTGMTASIQDERSQHQNKAKALKLISARVHEHLRQQEESARGAERSSLMGGGDRSERIRTYNFPQDRVTDHRCKHTTHGLEKLLLGGVDGGLVATFLPIMRQEYKEELMKQLESSSK